MAYSASRAARCSAIHGWHGCLQPPHSVHSRVSAVRNLDVVWLRGTTLASVARRTLVQLQASDASVQLVWQNATRRETLQYHGYVVRAYRRLLTQVAHRVRSFRVATQPVEFAALTAGEYASACRAEPVAWLLLWPRNSDDNLLAITRRAQCSTIQGA